VQLELGDRLVVTIGHPDERAVPWGSRRHVARPPVPRERWDLDDRDGGPGRRHRPAPHWRPTAGPSTGRIPTTRSSIGPGSPSPVTANAAFSSTPSNTVPPSPLAKALNVSCNVDGTPPRERLTSTLKVSRPRRRRSSSSPSSSVRSIRFSKSDDLSSSADSSVSLPTRHLSRSHLIQRQMLRAIGNRVSAVSGLLRPSGRHPNRTDPAARWSCTSSPAPQRACGGCGRRPHRPRRRRPGAPGRQPGGNSSLPLRRQVGTGPTTVPR
jgi:hypothetical protein